MSLVLYYIDTHVHVNLFWTFTLSTRRSRGPILLIFLMANIERYVNFCSSIDALPVNQWVFLTTLKYMLYSMIRTNKNLLTQFHYSWYSISPVLYDLVPCGTRSCNTILWDIIWYCVIRYDILWNWITWYRII